MDGDARGRDGGGPTSALDRLHGALSRVTSSGRYLPIVDGLRFVAIAGVILFHVGPLAGEHLAGASGFLRTLGYRGWFGVQVFFAVSGFVLGLPFAEEALRGGRRIRVRDYYKRRLLRIEPPFVIAMTLLYALIWLRNAEHARAIAANFVATVLYVQNQIYGQNSPIASVTWSLEVEVQFYLVAPFLARLLYRGPAAVRRGAGIATMLAVGAVVSYCDNPRWLSVTVLGQLPYFLAGMMLADLVVSSDLADDRRSWNADAACIAAVLATFACLMIDTAFVQRWKWLLLPPLVLVAFVAAFRSVGVRRLLTNRWICVLGGMCYTTYLYHFHLMRALDAPAHAFDGHGVLVDFLVQAAIMIPAVFLVSAVLFVLFEKPFMYRDWPARFGAWVRRG